MHLKFALKDILYIQGLKDYVILHSLEGRVITPMNLKTKHEQLPKTMYLRVGKSYLINTRQITSFDNIIMVKDAEIALGVLIGRCSSRSL